jgi:hypothetical protein
MERSGVLFGAMSRSETGFKFKFARAKRLQTTVT